MININSREVAAEALIEVFKDEAYANITLKRILKKNGAMSTKDKAFVTEIVNGTLRNLIYIDYIINKVSSVNTKKMKPFILSVLRISVYQLKFMNVPDSAVCNEAVKLVKAKNFGKLSNFVNAVLRNIIRNQNDDITREPVEYLSIKYSHPKWLIKMWLHEYSYDFVKQLCKANNTSPDVTIAVNILKTNVDELKDSLIKKGIVVNEGIYNKNAIHISKVSNMILLDEFKEGLFHVQDESSMIAVSVLNPQKGEKILDICAAPGGKSVLMAQYMNNQGCIVSRDIYDHKIELIKEISKRLGISIIKAENKDALIEDTENKDAFDRVLVDAPCSGLGLIRKKPDIKFRKSGTDIDNLINIQRGILLQASKYVKKGGILVYSTCTICKKENFKNTQWFEENFDFEAVDIKQFLPKDIEPQTKNSVQLFPNLNKVDGFFISIFRRKTNEK